MSQKAFKAKHSKKQITERQRIAKQSIRLRGPPKGQCTYVLPRSLSEQSFRMVVCSCMTTHKMAEAETPRATSGNGARLYGSLSRFHDMWDAIVCYSNSDIWEMSSVVVAPRHTMYLRHAGSHRVRKADIWQRSSPTPLSAVICDTTKPSAVGVVEEEEDGEKTGGGVYSGHAM